MLDMKLRLKIAARSLLLQGCWNYECMQNLGFAFALAPWLKRIERRGGPRASEGLRRHLEYFNTQPYMASFVLGVTGRLEEELAEAPAAGRAALAARISRLKAGFGAALAGIGDAFFWGTLRPLCAAVAISEWLALRAAGVSGAGGWAAATYLLLHNAPALWVRWRGLDLGYRWGEAAAVELKRFRWQERMRALRWVGVALAGGVAVWALSAAPWDAAPRPLRWVVFAAALGARAAGQPTPRLYAAAVGLAALAAWGGA